MEQSTALLLETMIRFHHSFFIYYTASAVGVRLRHPLSDVCHWTPNEIEIGWRRWATTIPISAPIDEDVVIDIIKRSEASRWI